MKQGFLEAHLQAELEALYYSQAGVVGYAEGLVDQSQADVVGWAEESLDQSQADVVGCAEGSGDQSLYSYGKPTASSSRQWGP